MSEKRWWISTAAALVVCALTATATAQPQAPPRPGNTLNWAFGGTVHTVARAGNVAFVGGRFNAVAARHNVVGGFAVISSTTSHRALRTARVHGNVNAVVGDGSGGWFVGGNFTFVGAERRPQIVHLLADGRIDSAWTGRVDGRVLTLALAGGTLFVGGEFAVAGSGVGGGMSAARQNLAAFSAADGTLLPAVSSGADGVVLGLAAFGNTLYVGGEFATMLGVPRAHVAAIDITTGAVTGWNPGSDGAVRALLPAGDGATVYVGGLVATAGGAARANLAQLDAATGAATSFAPAANDAVLALALDGSVLYAGGRFTSLGGSARNRAGAVHATTGVVEPWDPNADDAVLALAVAGPSVYLGGEFLNVGGRVRLHAARVAAATAAPEPWHPALNDPVRSLVVAGDQVTVGGSFEALGAHARRNLAAIDLESGQLLPWNPRADGVVLALTLGRDRRLYVGGGFATIAGQARARLAAFDLPAHALASWNPGADATVRALDTFTDGAGVTTVYAGGDFTQAGGGAASRLAAIGGAGGTLVPGFTPGATDDAVLALDVDATHVYAGGRFTSLGGSGLAYLARLDRSTGAVDATWAPAPGGEVRAVDRAPNVVYAGGAFASMAGAARANLAALSLTAPATATAWAPNANRSVNAIDRDGPYVFVGGTFSAVDGLRRPRLAMLLAAGSGPGPYLLPWRPRWYGVVHAIDARLEGLLAGGDGVPDLDYEELDPVGRVAFYPRAGVPGRPGPPTDLHATARGARVSLDWGPPLNGAEPAFYVLEAGTTPGGREVTGGTPVGSDTSLDVSGVPPGQYYLRLRSVSPGGISGPSEEILLVVGPTGCAGPPEAPVDLAATVSGSTVLLSWSPSPTPDVTGYRIVAGAWPQTSGFATVVPATTTSLAVPAPAGVFAVRVAAVSACGTSSHSAPVIVGVGGALLPPGEPLDFTAEVIGSTVAFTWAPPVTGGVPAGYVLEAGSGPGLSDIARVPLAATTASAAGVPPGTYFVRVVPVNAAGAGQPSAELQIVVP
jgi:hypothetical protein